MTWDDRMFDLARHIATWSKDRSRQTACVIIGPNREIRSTGYNGFPRGVDDTRDDRHQRPAKYKWTEHAERNAIYNAARVGVSLEGCTMYLPWYPCADCARAIIQAGISNLMCVEPDWADPIWKDDFDVALTMFSEAGVVTQVFAGPTASPK